ncbi:hypothetical protein B0H13DRAFT_2368470 [Mycena leptocephala]|nr:hypothetical protein B0H13DRAFT_2368470 [Mycena leptocephala]
MTPSHRAAIAASDFRTKHRYARKASVHSDRYRERKNAEDRAEKRIHKATKQQARKLEAHAVRKLHLPQTSNSPPLPQNQDIATPRRVPQIFRSKEAPPPAPKDRPAASDEDSDADDSPASTFAEAISQARRARPTTCRECGLADCPGCACMCPVSTVWLDHNDGHFFPTCKLCGGDCPGCMCMCPRSRVLVEHGGHFNK